MTPRRRPTRAILRPGERAPWEAAGVRSPRSGGVVAVPGDEFERHAPDHDLVSASRAGAHELTLDTLADEPLLQAHDGGGIVEVGLGYPTFDAAAGDPVPIA